MVHEVQMGTRKRMSFSRINEVLDMPDLIEVQKNSYKRFVEEDLREVLDDISPITDYTENSFWSLSIIQSILTIPNTPLRNAKKGTLITARP